MSAPSSLSPEALAALPETSRIAVSMLFSDAFTWLYMVAAGLSVIGLTAAIPLRPTLMPVSEWARRRLRKGFNGIRGLSG